MIASHSVGWLDSNAILACTFKLLYWDAYLYYGFAIAVIGSIWVNTVAEMETKGNNAIVGRSDLLTRIHEKWYDLSAFDHPGGPIALGLAKGRDATALFESHHPFMKRDKLLKILSKYEIAADDEKSRGCALMDPTDDGYYSWEGIDNDKFVSDLKALVNDYFSKIAEERGVTLNQAAKATPARWILILSLMMTFFGTLPWYIKGTWPMLVVTPLLAWLAIVTFWHDALHFSLSSDWRVNAWLPYVLPLLSSPWIWYHHHVIGHHAYTNIARKDPDLAHAPQLMREHESIKWKPTHMKQAQRHHMLFVWSIASSIGLNLLSDIRALIKLSYNNVVPCEPLCHKGLAAHIGGRIIYVYAVFVWPFLVFSFFKALIWATVPNAIFSICFMLNTQINHLTNKCAHASSKNFYKHQVVTAQNFGNESMFCYFFSGGLNYQIEHHLFPMINHCHLPALSSGVKLICKRHGVPYNHVEGYGEAIAEHFSHTEAMSKPI